MSADELRPPAALGLPRDEMRAVPTIEVACTEFYEPLARYATWLVRDSQLAADLVQEAFVRLAARWVGIREPRAYLFTIVTNLARREWRRLQRERTLQFELEDGVDPTEAVAIRLAVYRLPAKEREVIWLHYYADLGIAEIARVTRRPEGTVKSHLYDARRRLARALEEERDGRP